MSYTASYIVNSSSAQGTTDFQFTFPYIKEEHIEVFLNFSKITQGSGSAQYQVITNVSPKLIRLNTGITSANLRVEVRRNSSLATPLVDYADGSTLTANDLDTSALQSLYIDQELKDNQSKTVSVDEATGLPSLGESGSNLRLTKVADPTAAQDAATKNYVDTKVFTSAQIQDGTITSADIADGTIVNADVNASASIEGSKLQASTSSNAGSMSAADKAKIDGIETGATADQTNAEIRAAVEAATDSNVFTDADHTKLNAIEASATADQTNAEIRAAVEAATDSNVFTDADHTKLNGIETAATADQTASEIKTSYESNAQTNPLTDAEKAVIDGVTSNTSELNKLDGVTASTAELNIVAGKSFKTSSGTLDTTSDTEIPSSKVIAAHVASSQTAIGGFTTIADEVSFPNTQPATGVVVSINNAAGVVINGSGVSTTGRRLDSTTVTINGFPSSLNSETLAAGVGLVVTSTSTANTYAYHKLLAAETDVKQLSDDINDFNARYRVAGSAPGSNNDEGDLYFDTAANKMKVYNGSAWDDVASVGSFFVNTLSSSSATGGGSATFNGSAYRFTLSNAGTSAQQHIVSVNGVIQKPNSGTSQPSEGFAISGNDIIFSAAPASGSDSFIITCGSSVSIGTPSANSVNSSHIIDGSIVNGDISNSANIAGSKVADDSIPEVKLDIHNTPATDKYLKYTSNGMEWSDGASEGTDVKSTGESGTTKFLRVDGDGTCSWQVPPTLTLVDEDNMASNSDTSVPSQQSTKAYVDAQVGSISAAPEIEATASGAISANDAVIINPDGTVSKPATIASAFGSKQEFSTNQAMFVDCCYEPVNNKVVVVYADSNDSYQIKARAGTVDGSNKTITWGTTIDLHTNTDNQCKYPKIAATNDDGWCVAVWWSSYDSNRLKGNSIQTSGSDNSLTLNGNSSNATRGLIINSLANPYTTTKTYAFDIAWNTGSSGRAGGMIVMTNTGYTVISKAVKISSDGTLQAPGSQLNLWTGMQRKSVAIEFNPDNNNYLVVAGEHQGDGASYDFGFIDARVIYTDTSDNVVVNTAATVVSDENLGDPDIMGVSYAPKYKKFLVSYRWSNNANGTKVYGLLVDTNSITTSGGTTQTLTAGTSILASSANFEAATSHMMGGDIVFDEDKNCWIMTWRGTTSPNSNTGLIGIVKYDGTSLSTITSAQFDSGNSRYSATAYDPDTKRSLVAYQDSTNDGQVIVMVPNHDTLRDKNFIGFAQAGYSNGATAKISVVGNQSTHSSLTPASTYYVQTNGTISTTADSPSVEAGIALSSTKLLIKG